MAGTNLRNFNIKFFIFFFFIFVCALIILLFILCFITLSLFIQNREKSVLMSNEYFRKLVIISCIVYDGGELVIFLQVERFFCNILLFHQIWIIFIHPLHPSITVHNNQMLLSKYKIGYNLSLKIAFQIIVNNLLLSVSRVDKNMFAIAYINVI